MPPFPVTPIPGLGTIGVGGYFNQDMSDLKPPLAPFARNLGSLLPSPTLDPTSPRLASPAPIGMVTSPPTIQQTAKIQFPPPQYPASPTRPHVGLPPPSSTRPNVGLPTGTMTDYHLRRLRDRLQRYQAPPIARPVEAVPTPPTPSTKPNLEDEQATPTPMRKPVENGGWNSGSWGPANGGQEDQLDAEPPVSTSKFLSENKEMGIYLPAIEGAAVRESVEEMAAAAREANGHRRSQRLGRESSVRDRTDGNGKKLVSDEENRGSRPLPVPLDMMRKRSGSIESLSGGENTSRVAAVRSRYDNPGAAPLSPTLTQERPPLAHAVSDMINVARAAEPQMIRGGVWPPRQTQAIPPSSFQQRSGLVSPSLDNVSSWSAQREREWRAREYALNLEQRELELERVKLVLQREHQQFDQFTGSSTSAGTSGASWTTGLSGGTSKSGTTDTSGTTGTSGTTNLSGTTAVGGVSSATIGVHSPFGRRPRSPESIPDDTRPPWATKPAPAPTRYTTPLRDDSDAESSSPTSKDKKGTWMGRGLRRLSMPAPFAERKQIQVVSIPAPNRKGIGNRRSFDVRH
ncbi:hypothetical protein FRC09_020418 [Ceratobasidium sp. 395]|nr:hypothetical protein FRC09_020418 [Ceratobasidium sp. 395]